MRTQLQETRNIADDLEKVGENNLSTWAISDISLLGGPYTVIHGDKL